MSRLTGNALLRLVYADFTSSERLSVRRNNILGDPGAVSRVDKKCVMKVYCTIETSPWALTLTEPVPEAFEFPASDWPEKFFSGQSAKRSCRVTLVFSYTT